MGATRRQIRRHVGDLTGDMLLLTATAAGAADGSTVVDRIRLARDSGALAGRLVRVSRAADPANAGVASRVVANDFAARSVTLDPPLPAQSQAGDEIELWNERDTLLDPAAIDRHINAAILAVADVAVDYAVTEPVAFASDAPVVALPDDWAFFAAAEWEDADGRWHEVPPRRDAIAVDPTGRTVALKGRASWLANGYRVRFRGAVPAAALEDDDDETDVPMEYLAHQAAGEALLAAAHRRIEGARTEARANLHLSLAKPLRERARRRGRGRLIRIG